MDQWNVLKAAVEGSGTFKLFSWIVFGVFILCLALYVIWFVWNLRVSNLFCKKVDIYYVEKETDKYQIGLLLEVVNKDINKIYIVTGAEYVGGFSLTGNGSVSLQSIGFFDGNSKVTGKYSLRPGIPTPIKLEVPHLFGMHILGGSGPILHYEGVWHLLLENKKIEVKPENVIFKGAISNAGWDKLLG
ncbi:MAG: hypothetical protein V1882_02490 [Candidatus Omnitrophota bacterium]